LKHSCFYGVVIDTSIATSIEISISIGRSFGLETWLSSDGAEQIVFINVGSIFLFGAHMVKRKDSTSKKKKSKTSRSTKQSNLKSQKSKLKNTKKSIPAKKDATSVEKRTLERVNRIVISMDKFLAQWDGSKTKPDGMGVQVEKIRKFHNELVDWQKKALKSQKKDPGEIVKRLRDLIVLCNNYS